MIPWLDFRELYKRSSLNLLVNYVLMSEPQQVEHLLVIKDQEGKRKRTIVLESATYSIGRDSTNSIVVDSPWLSRHHALLLRVTIQEGNHLFRLIDGDLQGKRSTNGLSVNGKRCFSHDLQPGDLITFGKEVRARYHVIANPSDVQFFKSCETEEVSGFLSKLSNSKKTLITPDGGSQNTTEAALERLASFPELISNPIIEIDLAGNITYLNPAAVQHFPDIREAKLQHPILAEIVSSAQNNQNSHFLREVKLANKVFEQSVHYLVASELIRIYMVEVTERKQVEEALRKSEERFQLAVRGSSDGLWDWPDTKKEQMWFAPRFYELLGYEDGAFEASFSKFKELLHPEDRTSTLAAVSACLSEQAPKDVEYRFRTQSGSYRWFRARGQAFWDEKSQRQRMSGSITDITERQQVEALLKQAHDELELRVEERTAALKQANKQLRSQILERQRAEEALRSSMAINRALLDAIPDWMFRLSRDGTLFNFKAAKSNNLPLPTREFLGKKLDEVFDQEIAQAMMDCVTQALSNNETQIFEYQLPLNNEQLYYEARIAVSAEDEVMAIIREITQRKRAEQDIRQALAKEKELNSLKSRFVAMTSHEFRTPLATILSSAELLEHYSHKWNESKKLNHLRRIQVAVKHMTGLLNDVLLLGKAEAGKLEFKPRPLELAKFCQELVEEIELNASNHTIAFRTHNQCPNACLDEKLLRTILSNLLSNAIKYSPLSDLVHFDLICEQRKAIFRIQDQGIGIPLAEQAQLFNSFERGSNVGAISGTGLGLAIVKKSVDLHGGQITVESQVGVGTKFIVTLPLNQHPKTGQLPPTQVTRPVSNPKTRD